MESKCPVCITGTLEDWNRKVRQCDSCDFKCNTEDLHRISAAMTAERRLVELVEAVRWERECEAFHYCGWGPQWWVGGHELIEIRDAATAAVDALVGGEDQVKHTPSPSLTHAFLQGAKFWEFHQTGGTMWQSDQRLCAVRAKEMEADGTLGVDALVGEG